VSTGVAESVAALIIRTLPNSPEKRSRDYRDHPPPFFSLEAMRYLAGLPLRHLLVDIPSVDRSDDAGQLNAHRIFWNVPPGSRSAGPSARIERTITEMIYVPDSLPDGRYLLNIQIPHFMSDAAPSRVLLVERSELK
jgi:kynurenine formamidase